MARASGFLITSRTPLLLNITVIKRSGKYSSTHWTYCAAAATLVVRPAAAEMSVTVRKTGKLLVPSRSRPTLRSAAMTGGKMRRYTSLVSAFCQNTWVNSWLIVTL